MDRNHLSRMRHQWQGVATHEGGVDRNNTLQNTIYPTIVATHEGGVDRNPKFHMFHLFLIWSPPTRVAWIETSTNSCTINSPPKVATHEGGVDRNKMELTPKEKYERRHPRGWRG